MGIGLSNADWFSIVHKTRTDKSDKCQAEYFPPSGNIKSSPEMEKWLKTHGIPKDEWGRHLVSTARGRRRQKRLGK